MVRSSYLPHPSLTHAHSAFFTGEYETNSGHHCKFLWTMKYAMYCWSFCQYFFNLSSMLVTWLVLNEEQTCVSEMLFTASTNTQNFICPLMLVCLQISYGPPGNMFTIVWTGHNIQSFVTGMWLNPPNVVLGVSMSKPQTSEFNCNFSYRYYVHCSIYPWRCNLMWYSHVSKIFIQLRVWAWLMTTSKRLVSWSQTLTRKALSKNLSPQN